MTGIRVETLCNGQFGNTPEELQSKMHGICLAAATGDPKVLTEEEARQLDAIMGNKYADFGGALNFAKAFVEAPQISSQPKNFGYDFVSKLYAGFLSTSVSEPPFLVDGYEFKKIAGDEKSVTLLINDSLQVRLEIPIYQNSSDFLEAVALQLAQATGLSDTKEHLEQALSDLPFMEGYGKKQPSKNPGRFNAASIQDPRMQVSRLIGGEIINTGTLKIDGFNRYFGEMIGKTRYYLDSADKDHAKVLYTWKPGDTEFIPFGSPVPPQVQPSFSVSLRGCFTANTEITLADGGQTTLAKLYDRYQQGETLPKVAVLNPETHTIVPQTPLKISRQYIAPDLGTVQLLVTKNESGERVARPLEVTPNHFLWVNRNEKQYWLPAGQIVTGDKMLVAKTGGNHWATVTDNTEVRTDKEIGMWKKQHGHTQGPSFSFDAIAQRPAAGAMEVYNISFERTGEMFYNFAVTTGGDAVIVHNKIIW